MWCFRWYRLYKVSLFLKSKTITTICKVSVEVNEKVLRGVNPNLDSSAALCQWVQQLVNYHTQLMVDDYAESVDIKFSRDMTPDELYDVIELDIRSIYADESI